MVDIVRFVVLPIIPIGGMGAWGHFLPLRLPPLHPREYRGRHRDSFHKSRTFIFELILRAIRGHLTKGKSSFYFPADNASDDVLVHEKNLLIHHLPRGH
jgi:hypothetical protein